jgi:hypothetical protein
LKAATPSWLVLLPHFASRFHLDLIVPGAGLCSIPENGLQLLLFLGRRVYVVRVITLQHRGTMTIRMLQVSSRPAELPPRLFRTGPPPGQVPSRLLVCTLYDERPIQSSPEVFQLIIDCYSNRARE